MSKVLTVKEKLIAAILDLRNASVDQGSTSETADKMVVEIRINELIYASQDEVVAAANDVIDEQNDTIDEQNETIRILSESQYRLEKENGTLRFVNKLQDIAGTALSAALLRSQDSVYRAKVDNTLLREQLVAARVLWNSFDSAPRTGEKFYAIWLVVNDAPEIATASYDSEQDEFVDDLGNVLNDADFWTRLSSIPVPERS